MITIKKTYRPLVEIYIKKGLLKSNNLKWHESFTKIKNYHIILKKVREYLKTKTLFSEIGKFSPNLLNTISN